jgi:hypothetical protein
LGEHGGGLVITFKPITNRVVQVRIEYFAVGEDYVVWISKIDFPNANLSSDCLAVGRKLSSGSQYACSGTVTLDGPLDDFVAKVSAKNSRWLGGNDANTYTAIGYLPPRLKLANSPKKLFHSFTWKGNQFDMPFRQTGSDGETPIFAKLSSDDEKTGWVFDPVDIKNDVRVHEGLAGVGFGCNKNIKYTPTEIEFDLVWDNPHLYQTECSMMVDLTETRYSLVPQF